MSAPGEYESALRDPLMIRWFAQNTDISHPKLETIPIGIANSHWKHGRQNVLQEVRDENPISFLERSPVIYVSYLSPTDQKRAPLRTFFCSDTNMLPTLCTTTRTSWYDYLLTISTTQFVLSPRGHGIDCHRTWEALAMGAIPIVEHSSIDQVFAGERVLIVDSLTNLNTSVLREAERRLSRIPSEYSKVYREYWNERIDLWRRIALR